jgi:hypothetical protein
MKVLPRCAAIALVLLCGVGTAAAQKYPTGSPGVNDNMTSATGQPASGSSTQSTAQAQSQDSYGAQAQSRSARVSQKHVRRMDRKNAMSAQGNAGTTKTTTKTPQRASSHAGSSSGTKDKNNGS